MKAAQLCLDVLVNMWNVLLPATGIILFQPWSTYAVEQRRLHSCIVEAERWRLSGKQRAAGICMFTGNRILFEIQLSTFLRGLSMV